MYDRTHHGKCTCIGTYADTRNANELSDYDGEERNEFINDEAGIRRTKTHGSNTDQSEETNDQRRIIVRRRGEEESQSRPVRSKRARSEETNQARLHQNRMVDGDRNNTPQHLEIVDPARIRDRVIWHEEPEKDENKVL